MSVYLLYQFTKKALTYLLAASAPSRLVPPPPALQIYLRLFHKLCVCIFTNKINHLFASSKHLLRKQRLHPDDDDASARMLGAVTGFGRTCHRGYCLPINNKGHRQPAAESRAKLNQRVRLCYADPRLVKLGLQTRVISENHM